MSIASTPWHLRRQREASRFRALVLGSAALLVANAGIWTAAAFDPIGSFRVIHVPEASTCGRAEPISRAEARKILADFAALTDSVTAADRVPLAESGAPPETPNGGIHAEYLAHASGR